MVSLTVKTRTDSNYSDTLSKNTAATKFNSNNTINSLTHHVLSTYRTLNIPNDMFSIYDNNDEIVLVLLVVKRRDILSP